MNVTLRVRGGDRNVTECLESPTGAKDDGWSSIKVSVLQGSSVANSYTS